MKTFIKNLKLKTKLAFGFAIIAALATLNGVVTKTTLDDLDEVKGDVKNTESLNFGMADIKFLVAHDLKLLMELITTDNKEDLSEFWKQHQAVTKEYDVAYKPVKKLFLSDTWDENYLPKLRKTQKLLKKVDNYRNEILVPVLQNVYDLRLKQLAFSQNQTEKTVVLISNIQKQIDEQDDHADSKAEEVFAIINQMDNLVDDLNKMASDEQEQKSYSATVKTISFLILIVLLAIIVAIYLSKYLVSGMNLIKENIEILGKGKLPKNLSVDTNDEIGQIAVSINEFVGGLQKTSEFAGEIGKGDFETHFEPLSDEDVLGNSLLEMRTSLIRVAEDEKKRNWATEGLAKFGDILRGNNEGLEVLADNIISGMVKYLGANQGGLFVVNDFNPADKHLELMACYAWNKKKYLHMRVDEGEGLVGQAWQENDTLYITDVPDHFVKITSGLGDANPKSFLIVPLTVNDETFGVIEIASFNYFEQYHIDFVNKLAESIASTLSTAKTNERTRILLEQSQQQQEEMRAQEEEMRQNMEEMAATQEEMQRKEGQMHEMLEKMRQQEEEMRQNMEEMEATQEQMEYQGRTIAEKNAETQSILDGVNAAMATIEFTPDGYVRDANANFLNTMKVSLADIHGQHHSNFVPNHIKNSAEYTHFWSDLASGKAHQGQVERINGAGETVWLDAIYSPIKDSTGNVTKVIKFASDITRAKEIEMKYNELANK
jgi:PAS domain-containing protein